jgi:hypothetical protein
MKCNYSNMHDSQTANGSQHAHLIEIDKKTAYHLAGHAAAIYLGNKHKQLPDVHFQIIIKPKDEDGQQADRFERMQGKCTAKIEGGRLIQSLPISYAEYTQGLSSSQQEEYLRAFEADIMNLLAGPLAEAKFVASRDGEVFNPNIVNLSALQFYGGNSNLKIINEYMESFMLDKAAIDQKLIEMFLATFGFVNRPSNWQAISALAECIQDEPKEIIHCEDVITFFDNRFVEENRNYSTLLPGYL